MCKIKRSSREGVPKVKVADGDVGNLGRVVVEDEIHIPTLQRKREDRRIMTVPICFPAGDMIC